MEREFERVLGSARCMSDLGRDFGCGLTQAELDHLARDEWARTADDVLWRRSKLGLHLTKAQADGVAMHMLHHPGTARPRRSDAVAHGCGPPLN